ncbi:GNAT family N-acetyltransferase [uncultured Pseudoflavonifractor sp.]|uniref:GNAT family N-acetyltransferase n=1 Tax=uncultured Pseudoflavonifractor sp. TaxID=1221379 RepID=UPI0025E19FB8|nr:GNAT family N-acetyltransferase [uncultured Pseudoflavonifractor sp.]
MIHFEEITEENFDAVIHMKHPEGEKFVASNSVSLAQAWLYRNDGDVFPFAIYEDDIPVGFLLLEEDREAGNLILWRIMISVEYEGRGYGTQAVRLVIEQARASGKYHALNLDCAEENRIAWNIYEKLGFHPTGVMNHGSVEFQILL